MVGGWDKTFFGKEVKNMIRSQPRLPKGKCVVYNTLCLIYMVTVGGALINQNASSISSMKTMSVEFPISKISKEFNPPPAPLSEQFKSFPLISSN